MERLRATLTVLALGLLSNTRMTCRLVSEERLSTLTKACRYHCAAGTDYIITVKGFCPRYVDYPNDE